MMNIAFIKGVNRNHRMLLPEYIEEYIDEENIVRVIDAYVNTLSLTEMGFTKTKEHRRGASGYHPRVLLKLYLYGYMNAGYFFKRGMESVKTESFLVMLA